MGNQQLQQSDRYLQSVFGENLKRLASGEPSITKLCRKLEVNRTQFNRYLSGEASPRPLLLNRICKYFNVDARILLEPLTRKSNSGIDKYLLAFRDVFGCALKPVSQSILADGFYEQWTSSLIRPGHVTFNMVRIYTEDGVRKFRVRIPDPLLSVDAKQVYPRPAFPLYGVVFRQGNGFVIIDNLPDSQIMAFTSYQAGYSIHPNIFPGFKLAGSGFAANQMHSYGPCFMERIPANTSAVLARARTPYVRKFADAPDRVRLILTDIVEANRGLNFSKQ